MTVKILFCYAREDELLLNELRKHLRPLQQQGIIDFLHDRDISAGTEWEHEIDKSLSVADIILPLISPDFINSDYSYSMEIKKALERHERREVRIIPIRLRSIYLFTGPLNQLQALPAGAKPVTDPAWQNIDQALYNVAEGISRVVGEMILKASPHLSTQPLQLLKQESPDTSVDIPQREPASSQSLFVREQQVIDISQDTSHSVPRHVFLSYVREDYNTVQQLYKALRAYNIEVWLDRNQLKPGYRWADAIREAIREGAFYIACFSSTYNNRPKTYMNEELTLAIEELRQRPTHKAWFIPVLLDDCDVPDRSIGAGETLRSLQWVTLHDNWNEGIRQILSVIEPNSARVHELIQALGDKSARARIRAADDLSMLGELAEPAIPALIQALDDDNGTVCAAVAHALGEIGKATGPVITQLIANIRDKDHREYANHHVMGALIRLGDPGIHALIHLINSPESIPGRNPFLVCTGIEEELGYSGKAVIVPLLDDLNNGSIDDFTAYRVLVRIRDSDAISDLNELLSHKRQPTRIAAAGALITILSEHHQSDVRATPSLLEEAHSALIEGIRSSDDDIRHLVISTVKKIGKPASKMVPLLIEVMKEPKLRRSAINALYSIGSEAQAAAPALIEAFNDPSYPIRVDAVATLGKIGEPLDLVVPALTKILHNAEIGVIAVIALESIGKPGNAAVAALISVVRWAQNPSGHISLLGGFAYNDIRNHAVAALEEIGDPACIPALMEARKDQSETIRSRAALVLQRRFGIS